MAYSTPVDIRELRDQAALISMAWKEHFQSLTQSQQTQSQSPNATPTLTPKQPGGETQAPPSTLETLTIETQTSNIIIRAIQPSLLLILVGSVPPTRSTHPMFKITPESAADARYPPDDSELSSKSPQLSSSSASASASSPATVKKIKTPSILSNMSTREKDMKLGVLHIQRKKIDALTRFLREDFDKKGFVMPADSAFP
jgi:hypothetical protein